MIGSFPLLLNWEADLGLFPGKVRAGILEADKAKPTLNGDLCCGILDLVTVLLRIL